MAYERTAAEIEQEIDRARQRLSNSLASLVSEVHPRAVARRSLTTAKTEASRLAEDGKAALRQSLVSLKRCYLGQEGVKAQVIAAAGTLAAVAVVVLMLKKK